MPCINASTTDGGMLCAEPASAVTSGAAAVPFKAGGHEALRQLLRKHAHARGRRTAAHAAEGDGHERHHSLSRVGARHRACLLPRQNGAQSGSAHGGRTHPGRWRLRGRWTASR